MANLLKKLSKAFIGPLGLIGPPRFPTDTSEGRRYSRLRYQALTINRDEVDVSTPPPESPVWAVLMEIGHPSVTETLFLLSDGTSSVYVSNGFTVLGGQDFENVKKANADVIQLANRDLHHFQSTDAFPIPEIGYTIFYGRTDAGLLVGGGTQKSLMNGQHKLSELFHAGFEILKLLRIILEEKQKNA